MNAPSPVSLSAAPAHSATGAGSESQSFPLIGLRARALVVGLNGVALLLTGLHLWVLRLPPTPAPIPSPADAEAAWWGLWPTTQLPAWSLALGATAVLLAAGWALLWELRLGAREDARVEVAAAETSSRRTLLVLCGLSLALVGAFFAFPVVHTRWGDAYLISRALAWPDAALRLTYSWQAPLDVGLHSVVWQWLGPARGWETALPVYRLLSPVAGALYLFAAVGLARQRHPGFRAHAPWLVWGLFATLGVVQLFFGYVENYSFAAALILLYLWLALRVLEGEAPLWAAATALAIAHALHPSTLVLAPSLLVLGWIDARTAHAAAGRNNRPGCSVYSEAALQIGLPMLLVGAALFVWMEAGGHGLAALLESDRPGGSDGRWFVPLRETTTRWEHYTLFSWAHLRDWLNLQLLVAPAVGPALLLAAVLGWGRLRARQMPALLVVGAATAGALLFTVVWNADYGGQRDWDLFSLSTLPMTLLCALALPSLLRGRRLLAAAGPLLLMQALHTAAWIYSNTLPWEWPG